MLRTRLVFILLFALAAGLIASLVVKPGENKNAAGDSTLVMFCAAGMKAPVSEIANVTKKNTASPSSYSTAAPAPCLAASTLRPATSTSRPTQATPQ